MSSNQSVSSRRFQITTADEVWHVRAQTADEAVKKAFTERPPRALGALVQIDPDGEKPLFGSAEHALALAGLPMDNS